MAVTFNDLWTNHPANQNTPEIEPCKTKGVSNHANQCVIRLGVAMTASGISLASYTGVFCWSGHKKTHPLRVEEMKLWLNSNSVSFVPAAEIYKRDKKSGTQKSHSYFIGHNGIVACRNFWGAGNQGDHIDLWDGSRMAHGGLDYFERSEEIWFWEMD